jgi:release factor glutamine methyltransferase
LRDLAAPIDPALFTTLVSRREAREPLALILGTREFWSLEFAVSPATLIPRPDSETLVEAAVAEFANRAPPDRVLDLGTGTGCLLLATLAEFPHAFGIGIDLSAEAVALAARNAAALDMTDRTAFLCSDWAGAVGGRFDLILCNPPYIPSGELANLMPEVARYEPKSALDGGQDGFAAYRSIIPGLPRLLAPDGSAILELGQGQAETAAGLARDTGFQATLRRDLSGIDRVLVLQAAPP